MSLLAFAAPILPGRTQQWKRFVGELNGARRNEYLASRRQLRVHERAFLQSTPQGDVVIVTLEGNDPKRALHQFGIGDDTFTKWFVQQVNEIHGMDLTQASSWPLPELGVDSQELRQLGA